MRDDTSTTAGETASAKSMKDMPAMDMPKTARGSDANATTSKDDSSTITFTAAQVRNGKVRWEGVTVGTAQATMILPGQVVPNEDRTARLGSPVAGRVLSVHVSPGDRVARGRLLVTLASPEASMAQSDVSKAVAALTAARAQAAYATAARERAERLLTLKAIPRQDYERAVADDAQAQSMLTQATAEVGRARATAGLLSGGATVNGELALRAPIAGVVLARTAVPGAVVEVGAPLVVVSDPSQLWLTVNAPEALLRLFRRGAEVDFSVPAYPGEQFRARIDAVGAGLDPLTRTLPVRAIVTVEGSRGRLKPEMLASVTATGGPAVPAVLLPDDAVQLVNGRPIVFIATPHESGGAKFTARRVETGTRSSGRIAVTRGLVAGDVVVISGAFRIKAQLQNGRMPEMEM